MEPPPPPTLCVWACGRGNVVQALRDVGSAANGAHECLCRDAGSLACGSQGRRQVSRPCPWSESLAAYQAACLELPDDFDLLRWWRLKKKDLPFWARLLRIVLLLAPSSAPVERVFSLMRRTLSQEQDMALADIVRTSLMLQYNYRDHNSARASDRRACQV